MANTQREILEELDRVERVDEDSAQGDQTYRVTLESDGLTLDEYEDILQAIEGHGYLWVEGLGPPTNRPIAGDDEPAHIHVVREGGDE